MAGLFYSATLTDGEIGYYTPALSISVAYDFRRIGVSAHFAVDFSEKSGVIRLDFGFFTFLFTYTPRNR